MTSSLSHVVVAVAAAISSTVAGIVGGLLANEWSWGVAAGTLTLIAVFSGLEGLKVIAAGRAAPPAPVTPDPEPGSPESEPAADTPRAQEEDITPTPSGHTVTMSAGGDFRMNRSVVTTGNVDLSRRTNIHMGGAVMIAAAVVLLLITIGRTIALANDDSRGAAVPDHGAAPAAASALSPVASAQPVSSAATAPKLTSGDTIAELSGTAGNVMDVSADGQIAAVAVAVGSGTAFASDVQYTTYDVKTGQRLAGPTTVEPRPDTFCGILTPAPIDGRSLIVDLYPTDKPAEGIYPATRSAFLRGLDARTLATVWTAPLGLDMAPGEAPSCSTQERLAGRLQVTDDGRYGMFGVAGGHLVIDLADGTIGRVVDALAVIGNYIATGRPDSDAAGDQPSTVRILNPASLGVVGTIKDPTVIRMLCDSVRIDGYVSGDGTLAVILGGVATASTFDGDLVGLSLPGGGFRWSSAARAESLGDVRYEPIAKVFITSYPEISATSATSGVVVWGPVRGALCGATDGRVFVAANNQLAVLDAATGQQLSFEADKGCPLVLPGVLWERPFSLRKA